MRFMKLHIALHGVETVTKVTKTWDDITGGLSLVTGIVSGNAGTNFFSSSPCFKVSILLSLGGYMFYVLDR